MTNEIIKHLDSIKGKKIEGFIESDCFHGTILEGEFDYDFEDEIFTTCCKNENGKINDDFVF